jgi:RNA polymerase sigma-70 factor (ECF subfamily)
VAVNDARDRSDRDLLVAVVDRDRNALHQLYDRHAPWLRLRLGRRCSDEGLVEEVVQDVFVAVWRKPYAYAGAGDVGAWLWGIAIRRLLASLRPRRAFPMALLPEASEPSAEDVLLLGVQHGDVGTALDRLSPELRAVMTAVVLDGLTSAEAARLLGIPAGTVRTRMLRARTLLREALS